MVFGCTNVFDVPGVSFGERTSTLSLGIGSQWKSSEPAEEAGTQGTVEIWGAGRMQVKAISILEVGSL